MKKFILGFLVLASSVASATEVTVLDANLPNLRTGRTQVITRFYVDTEAREGYAEVVVSEEEIIYYRQIPTCRYDGGYWGPGYGRGGYYGRGGMDYCFPNQRPMPTPVMTEIFRETVKIDGLVMIDDKVIFQGAEGEVECGTMGVSRVFKVPTLFLTGKCDLQGRVLNGRNNGRVVVKFSAK